MLMHLFSSFNVVSAVALEDAFLLQIPYFPAYATTNNVSEEAKAFFLQVIHH
jgi:hypothetical protein